MSWLDRVFGGLAAMWNGTPQTERPFINFIGAGVSVADNPDNESTDVTISGADATLSTAFFVDAGFVPEAVNSDGSIAAPFTSIGAALQAVDALGPNVGGTLLVVPGYDYTEGTLSWAGTGSPPRKLSINALGQSLNGAATVLGEIDTSGGGVVSLRGLSCTIGGSGPVHAVDCAITGVGTNDLTLEGGTFQGTGGAILWDGTTVNTITGCTSLDARGGEIDGAGTIISCSGTAVSLRGTKVPSARTIVFSGSAGVLTVDATSNYYFKQGSETLTNGTKTIAGDLAA
jgi:hypothetical protein